MPGTNSDLIRGGYEAFAAQDIPGVLALFDEAIVWTVPPDGDWGGSFKGHDEVLGFFISLPGRYGTLSVVPQVFVEDGDRVVALGEHHVGEDGIVPFAHAWVIVDGKVRSFTEYADNVAFRAHIVDS